MIRAAQLPVVVLGLSVPVVAAFMAAPLARSGGPVVELVEGLIVGVTVLSSEVVALRLFGGFVRRRVAAERLAARNARIRAGVLDNSVAP